MAAMQGAKKRGHDDGGPPRTSRDEIALSKKKKKPSCSSSSSSSSSSSPPPSPSPQPQPQLQPPPGKLRGSPAPTNNSPRKPVGSLMDWDPADLEELIGNLSEQLPKVDNVKYSTQMEKVDWKKVRFGEHSAIQCREKWGQVITKIRRFRTLTELVIDAKEWVKHPWTTFNNPKSKNKHPDLPKKPLTPYFRYFLEKREKYSKENPSLSMTQLAKVLAQKFASLGEKKKQKYKDRYERDSEQYKLQMEKFRVEHPEMYSEENRGIGNNKSGSKYSGPQKPHTPAQLFLAEKMTKHTNLDPAEKKEYEEKYRHQWKALTETKRVKWIRKALADEQRYAVDVAQFALENPTVKVDPIKSVISKAEKDIKERIEGKPEKPPNSGYSLYSKIMLKQLKDIPSKEKMAEISKRWKMLNDKEKQDYTREALEATERYHTDYANYIARLPEDERKKIEEEKGKGKRKASAMSRDDGPADGNIKPKKPMSALFCYQQENLPLYKKNYPEKSEQDLTRTMAREYGELSEKKKNYYKQLAELARKESIMEIAKESKSKRKGTKLFKGEPKKPPQSGYLLFTMDAIAKLDIEPKERMQEIAKRWRELKASEREKYKKKCAEHMKKYAKDLAKFEASLSVDDRKLYQQFKGSGKKVAASGLKRIKVIATENEKGSDDEDEESEKEDDEEEEEGENDSSNGSDSSEEDSSDDESDKSESGSDSKSDSDSSESDSDNTKNESSASSSEESDSDDSGSESDSGSDSDK